MDTSRTWIEEQAEMDELIRKNDFSKIPLEMLNKMYTHLDVDIRYMQGQLERVDKAAMLAEERLLEPANTNAWRDENERLKKDILELEIMLKDRNWVAA